IPLVYAVVNVAHTVIAIPAGVLSDKIGKERVLLTGYGIFLVTSLLILLSPKIEVYAYIIALIFGIYIGIIETIQRALIPKYAESSLRGTAYGLYYLVVGIAFFIANTVVGALWQYFGSSTAAAYSMALSFIAIIGMLLLLNYQKRKSSEAKTQ
ncbi:MAG: MFS transporter, partial [Candidatus Bathyarchaeia archaeon]